MTQTIDQDTLIKAGALLPLDAALPGNTLVDDIDARVYTHPALGSRPVIRLTATPLAPGEDASMEYYGFENARVVEGIARRQRQTLGFPQWVLANDPKNGPKAIEIARQLNRQARVAKSKPGHAKEALDAIGDELAKTHPHFLPTFYEQVGRAFLEAGNTNYAATAFGKAREAEAMYALEVDEAVRRDVFLEFALVGALTNKAMGDYAQDLARRYGDGQGYEQFFELCVRRVMGGTPPAAAMVDQLRRLARSAGLNAAEQDERFVAEVWQAPSLARAATKFWKTYRKAFAKLCKTNPAMRGRLLNLAPSPPSSGNAKAGASFKAEWLELLRSCVCFEALTRPAGEVPAEAAAEDGAAAWFANMMARSMEQFYWRAGYGQPEAMFTLLREMAPRLRADGAPVDLAEAGKGYSAYYYKVDIDLVDLALELGVDVRPGGAFDLKAWAEFEGGAEHHRALEHVGRSEAFAAMLDAAVGVAFSDERFQQRARQCAGLAAARRRWLERRLEEAVDGALPALEEGMTEVQSKVSAATFAEFPDLYERACAIDPVPGLGATMRNGLLDEYAWPAFEQVLARFTGKSRANVVVRGAFPYLIVHDELRAVVVGHGGIVLEHELRLPPGARPQWMLYAGGQLAVGFYDANWSGRCYWSGAPSELLDGPAYLHVEGLSVELPDGGMTFGRAAIYPGDSRLSVGRELYSDGEHFWTMAGDWGDRHMVEFEPRGDRLGRRSMPKFFEEYADADHALVPWGLRLYPLGSKDVRSPFGGKDGLYGYRVREKTVGTTIFECEGIDGRRFRTAGARQVPGALMSFPGDDAVRPLEASDAWALRTPDGRTATLEGHHAHTHTASLPVHFWHFLEPRDAAGSARLRRVSDDEAGALLLVALLERLGRNDGQAPGAPPAGQQLGHHIASLLERFDAATAALGSMPVRQGIRERIGAVAGWWQRAVTGEGDGQPRSNVREHVAAAAGWWQRALAGDVQGRAPATLELSAFVGQLLPELTDATLRAAVVDFARAAAARTAAYFEHLGSCDPAAVRAGRSSELPVIDDGAASLAVLHLLQPRYPYMHCPEVPSIGAVLEALAAFLIEDAPLNGGVLLRTAWPAILGRESVLAFHAYAGGGSDEQRATLTALLRLWRACGFMKYEGRFRYWEGQITARERATYMPTDEDTMSWSWTQGENRYVGITTDYYAREHFVVVEYAPDGRFKPLPGAAINEEFAILSSRISARQLDALLDRLDAEGPVPFDRARVEALSAKTGLTYAEACLVWTGMPNFSDWNKNFLPTELRTAMGLKVAEADVARNGLRSLDGAKKQAFFAAAIPDDIESIWSPAPGEDAYVDHLAAAWNRTFGRRAALPDDVLLDLQSTLELNLEARTVLSAIVEPETDRRVAVPVTSRLDLERADAGIWLYTFDAATGTPDGELFGATMLIDGLHAALHLAANLPVGDAVRGKIPAFIQAVRARLCDPGLMLQLLYTYHYVDTDTGTSLRDHWHAQVDGPQHEHGQLRSSDDGLVTVVTCPHAVAAYVRPARLLAGQTHPILERLAILDEVTLAYHRTGVLEALTLFQSEGFGAVIERIEATPVPDGQYETNPLHAAPELVATVRAALELGEDAAVLFLQLLALYHPTTVNVRKWNGWTAGHYNKAAGELVERKLVIEARRARAGRKHFLDGPWEDLKKPHLPLESWKLALYEPPGAGGRPLSCIVPLEPVHRIFERAWARWQSGDRPGF